MRAIALLGVLIIAKLLILAGRPIELSFWFPFAYFWQDVLVVCLFAMLDRLVRRAWFAWTLYGLCIVYITINVPIGRVLSSPLTWSMLGAAGAALSDSIKRHVTPVNVLLMTVVLIAGIVLPLTLKRFSFRSRLVPIALAVAFVAIGPTAATRIETNGLERNAMVALAMSAMPRISARTGDPAFDWRLSPVEKPGFSEDLSRFSSSANGRNVVLILLESAGAQYLKAYGSARDPMPNLSQLSQDAIVFERAYGVYPESIKEFFSVLCSRYPAMDTDSETYAQVQTPTIASELRRVGYRTALFHSGRFMYLGMHAVVSGRGYETLEDAGAIGGDTESSFGVDDRSTVRRTLEWIDALPRDQRFFVTYLPVAGHHPYDSPEAGPFPEKTESDRYLNALHYSDEVLGEFLAGLRERNLYDRTLFVIFGDHGQAFGDHDGNYGHSLFIYEENLWVPYLIVAPGITNGQTRIKRPISLLDTAPTIFDLIGLPAPAEFQGTSALRSTEHMALFCTDYSLSLLGLRDGCWKYIYEVDSGRSRLFNLCSDENETNDVASGSSGRVEAYRNRVMAWSAAQKSEVNR